MDKCDKILVPIDFTTVTDCVIKHAVSYAKATCHEIYLLHVIEKPIINLSKHPQFDNQLIEEATISRLREIANNIKANHQLSVEIIAKPGNIFDTITDVANEINASFIVMGTHGVKGMQYFTGSNALRIINNSTVPFIVVQESCPIISNFNNIVFPIDLKKEAKEKTGWAIHVAKLFNSVVNILIPKETDEFILRDLHANLNFTKKHFDTNKIQYTVQTAESSSSGFTDEIIKYADKIKADLIMIMTYPEEGAGGIGNFFLTLGQQKIITNSSQIPVMCMNPVQGTYTSYIK